MVEPEHDVEKIKERLDAICRIWFGGKPTEFARALDVKYDTLRQYMTGRSLFGNKMQARLRHIGIDPAWILFGTGKVPDRLKPDQALALSTPQVGREKQFRVYHRVPSGAADFAQATDVYQPWLIEDHNSSEHVLIEVSAPMSEGMRPVIGPGDRVLIARKGEINDGDLVAARWSDDDGAVRIYRRIEDKIQLWTLSPSIAPVTLSPKSVHCYKIVLIRKA